MQSENTKIKWRFIVNPAACKGEVGKRWPKLEKDIRSAGVSFDSVYTKRKMHAAELATQAIKEGFRHLVAVGGDGTAHETVNGILNQNICPTNNITFALLPVGTGNDWIKTHRIPKKFQHWLSCFKKEKTTFQDIGFLTFHKNQQIEKRFFINVAGFSYDGYVAKKAENLKATFFNSLFYLELMARCLFNYKIPSACVMFDEQKVEGQLLTIQAGICKYSGGGMQMVPHSIYDDGKLALTIAGKVNPIMVLLLTPLFYLGKIDWHPKVDFFQTTAIKIIPKKGETVWAEADGEFLGEAPVEIGLIEKGLKLIIP